MSTYDYSEIFKYASDGEIFEIIASPNSAYMGKRFVMKKHDGYGIVMKKLGTYHDNEVDTIVVPHGSITGSTYKRVEDYKEVSLAEALQAMKDRKDIYIKGHGYEKIDIFTDFDTISICDFDDLIDAEFFIQQ